MANRVALARQLAAEALGTAILVGTVIGSGIMGDRLSIDDAVALLGNTIATSAILYVLIGALGPISDAHFNPVVTLVFLVYGRGKARSVGVAVAFMVVQCVGGIGGTLLAHVFFEEPAMVIGVKPRTGWAVWSSEFFATFMLVGVILAFLRHKRDADVPIAVAMVIAAGYWWTSATSFANPAVALARGFTTTFAGIRLSDVPGFVVCELLGAAVAVLVWGWLLGDAVPALQQCCGGCCASEEEEEAGDASGSGIDRETSDASTAALRVSGGSPAAAAARQRRGGRGHDRLASKSSTITEDESAAAV